MGSNSIIGCLQLQGKELILWNNPDSTIGSRVSGAQESISTVDDVVAEHAFALIDGAREETSGASHTDAELAIVRDGQSRVQCLRENGLVGVHFELGGLTLVLDYNFV